eukprot:605843-Prymnesium_polylepis.1
MSHDWYMSPWLRAEDWCWSKSTCRLSREELRLVDPCLQGTPCCTARHANAALRIMLLQPPPQPRSI